MTFSVIIPLYNKEAEVARALRSVLAQTMPPAEIIVVDDGSTDGGAAVVEKIATEDEMARKMTSPLIRLIRQPNAGVSAARNRGTAEASGKGFAFLDADDEWRPEFLETIAALIEEYPTAGLWCTGFDVAKNGKTHPGRTPAQRGIVADYFGASMNGFVATGSSSVIPRAVIERVGVFPEGMALGEDQYMWTKIALAFPVAFTPERLVVVHASASNRSAAIYTPEATPHSFLDFYDPADDQDGDQGGNRADDQDGDKAKSPALNEYIARVALGKAITATVKGDTYEGLRAERDFAYNRRSRRLWWRLWILNRLPHALRPAIDGAYTSLAWLLARRGF